MNIRQKRFSKSRALNAIEKFVENGEILVENTLQSNHSSYQYLKSTRPTINHIKKKCNYLLLLQ